MNRLDTAVLLKMALEQAERAGLAAGVQYPEDGAKLPRCVIQPPLQRPRNGGGSVDLSFLVEVWDDQPFECIRLFDLVRDRLAEINLIASGNTPLFRDERGKWRFGGRFEARWNALTNALERNR